MREADACGDAMRHPRAQDHPRARIQAQGASPRVYVFPAAYAEPYHRGSAAAPTARALSRPLPLPPPRRRSGRRGTRRSAAQANNADGDEGGRRRVASRMYVDLGPSSSRAPFPAAHRRTQGRNERSASASREDAPYVPPPPPPTHPSPPSPASPSRGGRRDEDGRMAKSSRGTNGEDMPACPAAEWGYRNARREADAGGSTPSPSSTPSLSFAHPLLRPLLRPDPPSRHPRPLHDAL
ncbi:hypothetical protein FB451DRAFT_669653 [Mycena latifolia]|nr:hypothetical protein FB451DRAFT_669653 [Mycena latifolia]